MGRSNAQRSHDQTASDLFAEASRLAAKGNLQAATRLANRAQAMEQSGYGAGRLSSDTPPQQTVAATGNELRQSSRGLRDVYSTRRQSGNQRLGNNNSFGRSNESIARRESTNGLPRQSITGTNNDATTNPETLAILQNQLQDLPAAERMALINDWKGLEPAMVRLFLKNRQATGALSNGSQLAGRSTISRNNIVRTSGTARDIVGPNGSPLAAPAPTQNQTNGLSPVTPWSNQSQKRVVQKPRSNTGRTPVSTVSRSNVLQTSGMNPAASIASAPIAAPSIDHSAIDSSIPAGNPVEFAGGIQLDVGVREPERRIRHSLPSDTATYTPTNNLNETSITTPTISPAVNDSQESEPIQNASTTRELDGPSLGIKPIERTASLPDTNLANAVPVNDSFSNVALANSSAGPSRSAVPSANAASLQLPETNVGIPLTNVLDSNDALQQLIAQREAEIAKLQYGRTDTKKLIRKHVDLRMLYLIAGQQEKALQAIPIPEPVDQEFWQQMFWAVANYFDVERMPDTSERASQTVAQLQTAIAKLQSTAKLNLRNVSFCRKITSFGNFEPYDRDEFNPGEPVLLYAEIDNFRSMPTSEGQYRTLLKSTIQIYRDGNNPELVAEIPFSETEDVCSSQRRDYFHSYELSIPKRNLTLGPHLLKLTVVDVMSNKAATQTLRFVVR